MVKIEGVAAPVHGEVSPRLAHGIYLDDNLKLCLREAYNVLMTRNLEVAIRPPTQDQGAVTPTGVTKSYMYKTAAGEETIITFSNLAIEQKTLGSEPTFTTITTTWTTTDVQNMDAHENDGIMICVTPNKEPRVFRYDTTYKWETLQSIKTGTSDPPWHGDSDWPVSVSYMIGRFIFLTKKYFAGSVVGDPLDYDVDEQEEGYTGSAIFVITKDSAFYYNVADDPDRGFHFVRGGSVAFGGSPGGVWTLSGYEDPLSATNMNIKNWSSVGTYNVKAEDVEGGMVYFDADGTTCRTFAFMDNQMVNPIVNTYAKHLFETYKPVRMVYQRQPDTVLWILREDGNLVCFCVDERRHFWSFIDMGGSVEDIFKTTNVLNREYVWFVTDRGNGLRYENILTLDPILYDYLFDQKVSTTEGSIRGVESAAEGANGEQICTDTAHPFNDGDLVRLWGYEENYGYIIDLSADTYSIELENKQLVPYTPSVVGVAGEGCSPAVKEKTFAQFANMTVEVVQDSQYFYVYEADETGKITLDTPATNLEVGLPYECRIQPRSFLDIHNKDKATVNKIWPRVYQTSAVMYGGKLPLNNEKHIKTGEGEPFTGSVGELPIVGGSDEEATFYLGGRRGPFVMLSCIVEIEVADTGAG